MSKIYLAGKITENKNYVFDFMRGGDYLQAKGHTVLTPICLPQGLEYEDYMHICFAMIEVADGVALLPGWQDSPGAVREQEHAIKKGKTICFIPLRVVKEAGHERDVYKQAPQNTHGAHHDRPYLHKGCAFLDCPQDCAECPEPLE